MSDQHQPLWSDERIIQALDDGGIDHENWLITKLTMEVVRDEYETKLTTLQQENARLDAELAALRAEARWEPVEEILTNSGSVIASVTEHPDGETTLETTGYNIFEPDMQFSIRLPKQYRPCRLVSGQDGQRGDVAELIEAVKLAYRKHHLGDDSIGWGELSDKLLDALSNAMGVEELVKWQDTQPTGERSA